jgi:hypothetical protein
MLQAGWGRVDFTPREPVPLAGYGHLRDRLSTHVRDPLYARALAFEAGGRRVTLVIFDLLLVTDEMHHQLVTRLADTGAFVMVHATHTHSALGGLWDSPIPRLVLGSHRPKLVTRVLEAGEQAARRAIADLRPAQAHLGSGLLPGHNGNRRDPQGPLDEELTLLKLTRASDQALVASYPAHPVIVAEREHLALSADYPGELCRALEQHVSFAAFVQGALGGVDVLFPQAETISADENLRLMTEPMVVRALELAQQATPMGEDLACAQAEWPLPRPDSRPWYDDQPVQHALSLPLRATLNALFNRARIPSARVRGFSLGGFALVGTPSDLGVGIALAGKQHARDQRFTHPVIASQCDGYIGYLHRRDDYRHTPPPSHVGMGRYENAMSIFGRDMGDSVLTQVCRVLDELAGDRRASDHD